ncbi:MAG: Hsp20/alpha crystallin family protein [Oscillospiraceae bacterium]|nr:Hsp20/alpha crystallin family protein [Oscillospiraceae bacterium]
MLMPRIFDDDFFEDWIHWPVSRSLADTEKQLYGKRAPHVMRTDIREQEDHYDVDIDLPGFKKEEIDLSLEKGYLTVSATKGVDKDETDRQGRLIRQERYAGAMQRSFYVGTALTEEEIKARFEDGVLKLLVPKKAAPKLPEKRSILIEG